ncbi:energy transducer TonB [Burkholderia glumae]|uniref:energy transducer TonB n=1 Tax=Burkholderia glumae TaxID=337 RepID=UPI002036CE01|nr:energy transducer TonB [Burkholderia glumae]MCM2545821.1 TonB C-terminal domain-containing protein [Burkholderia glumae]
MPALSGFAARAALRSAGAAALAVLAACAAGGTAAPPSAAREPEAPATPLSGAAPLTLEHAATDAFVAQYGIAPDSPKAAILAHWREKMRDDPDIRRLLGKPGPDALGRSIATQRAALFSEGSLRVSRADRSAFIALGTRVLDAAPADCGGLKSMSDVMLRYLSLAKLTEREVDDYFRITYESLKRTALNTPLATINAEQRSQGRQALSAAIDLQLQRDPAARRALATAADPDRAPADAWCRNLRTLQHAVMAMPQPQRDWLLISIQTDAIAQLHARDAAASAAPPPPAPGPLASPAYAERVRQRIAPLVTRRGTADRRVTLEIRSAPDGTLLSAVIVQPSGDADWDDAVLRAVRAASPLPPDVGGTTPAAFRLTVPAEQ